MNVRLDALGRKVKEGEQVVIGGNDRYKQSCARCFYLDV
jgi:thymidine kinase